MKRRFFFLTLLSLLLPMMASAHDACIDGICYNFISEIEAEVTFNEDSDEPYYGVVVIPSSVTYDGKTYSVTSIGESAFSCCSSLTEVTIPNSVTSIGDGAFSDCSSLAEVTIGNSVTSIGDLAFYDCSGLTKVTIPNSVTSIGDGAFSDCSSLAEVTIGNSVTRIGAEAFKGCSSLTKATIPNSVTGIGKKAYKGCFGLTEVTIGNSVTRIGDEAFFGCSSLNCITIPSSVTSIGVDAFDSCSSLTEVTLESNAIVSKSFSSTSEVRPLASLFGSQVEKYVIGDGVTSIGNSAFSGCKGLAEVTIGNSVTRIGDYAFSGCKGLAEVTIGNSVTRIGDYAFDGCEGLTEVTIGNSVTSIGDGAFSGCSSLNSISIPNSVTSIGDGAFSDCSSLTSVTIGNSVTSIGDGAFSDCSSLTEATIPSSVTDFGDGAFSGCSGLTKVTIGSSVKRIGYYTFYGCSGLAEVAIPGSVTSIGYNAFENCSGLAEVTIPSSVTSVGHEAFKGCIGLTSVTIGSSVTSIDDEAFDSCRNLTSVTLESNAISQTSEDCTLASVFGDQVEKYVIGDGVTRIGDYAFNGCNNLNSITIPNSVTSIGDNAFDGCEGLTEVTIGNSVTSIGDGAFSGCSSLNSISIPNSVTSIGDGAFSGCSSLNSISIPNSVTRIGDNAFSVCSSLNSITIPNSVTSIGDNAFSDCSSLAEVTIGNSVTSIGDGAFSGCSSLKSISIPNSVTSIGDGAFSCCEGLTEVAIPSSVTSIGDRAFDGCSNLTSVTLESNAIVSKSYSEDCSLASLFGDQVEKYVIGDGVSSIGENAFYECSRLTKVTIPNSVTSIGDGAFSDCSSLAEVTIGNSVTSIGDWAFSDCSSLAEVTIGNSVTSIGDGAFSCCEGLTEVTIGNSVISIGNWAFEGCSSIQYNEYEEALYLGNDDNPYVVLVEAKSTDIKACDINAKCKVIYSEAFSNCKELKEVTIPGSVISIGNNAFEGCSSIQYNEYEEALYLGNDDNPYAVLVKVKSTDITVCDINAKCKVISSFVFSGCEDLTEITIPESVTSIGDYAFNGCSNLNSITIPNSVTSIGDYAFDGCEGLTEVTIGNSVTSIGDDAFSGCSSLNSISIPNSVTRIGDNAFSGCSSLNSITIPNSVTSIGYGAFSGCGNMNKVTIGNSVTNIGYGAFSDCSGLTEVIIPNSVTSIGNEAFSGCSSLNSITIPNSVTSIGDGAFKDCTGLTKVTIGSSVTRIGNEAFDGCSNLSSVSLESNAIVYKCSLASLFGDHVEKYVIGDGVTRIGYGAFSGCGNMTEVTIGNSVTSIGYNAFENCSGLAEVTIPSSVTKIGDYAFQSCEGLTKVTIGNNMNRIGNYTFSGCKGLTEVTIGNSVTSIGIGAFYLCSGLTSVTIPESVTSIDGGAFYGCSGLNSITIPSSVTNIGYEAFYGCSSLNSITIPNSVTSIDEYAFCECSSLTKVTIESDAIMSKTWSWDSSMSSIFGNQVETYIIGNGVTSIGDYAFESCYNLTEVTIPSSVTSIGDNAFESCYNLTEVTIPSSVTSIGDNAFESCSSLNSITIPNSVTSIGDGAFSGCDGLTSITIGNSVTNISDYAFSGYENLTEVTIGNSVTSIGDEAFNGCSSLNSITIPSSVTSIGYEAFYGCSSLNSITIPNSVTSIDEYAFCECSSLTKVTIPTSVTSISDGAFYGCSGLTEVTIPSSVTSIGEFAFGRCSSITFVTIPSSVTSIGDGAFCYCSGLTEVTIPGSVTSFGDGAFEGCYNLNQIISYMVNPFEIEEWSFDEEVYKNAILYVPAGTIETYQSTNGWWNFINIEEFMVRGYSIAISLPEVINVSDYSRMWLELTNTQSGQKIHYVLTDRSTYTFANIPPNTTWNVTLRNEQGDIFGQIDNVEVTDEDINITFASLTKPQGVALKVLTPDGKDVTAQTQITWIDAQGNYLAQGASLMGLPVGYQANYSVVLSKDLAMTYITPQPVDYVLTDGDNNITCQLDSIHQVQLSGKVKDAETGLPLSGATVSVSQTFGGKHTKMLSAKTDSKGEFTLEVANVPTTITFAATDYVSQTVNYDNGLEGLDGFIVPDVSLKPITGTTISLAFTYTTCEGETQNWYNDYQNVSYTLYNITKEKPVSQFNVQYPKIVLLEEAEDGDVLKLTATSRTTNYTNSTNAGAFMPVTTTVTIAEQKAEATFAVKELGKIQAAFVTTGNASVVGVLYDDSGKLVRTGSYQNASLTISDLADGQYTLVSMGSSRLFNSIYDLAQLPQTGLAEGKDYVKNSVNVKSGEVSFISIGQVPTLDESRLYYTGENTLFTVNKPSIVAGNYLTLSGRIDFKPAYASSVNDVQMIIDLPESCEFIENSVMVGSSTGGYMINGNRITIPMVNYTDRVRLCAIPTLGGDYAPSALVQFKLNGETITQPIGSANYSVKDLSISVPQMVAKTSVPISGTAIGTSNIEIYDNDVLIGQATSLANGNWSTTCELNEPYNLSRHQIYAKVTTNAGMELQSEVAECQYDKNAILVSRVHMLYEGYNLVFDFLNPEASKSGYYSFVPSRPEFTFTVDFTDNDPEKVSNVIVYAKTSDNTWTPMNASYNESKHCWVTSGKFNSSSLPVNVSVDYLVKDIEKLGDVQKLNSEFNEIEVAFNSWKTSLEAFESGFNNNDVVLPNFEIYDELENLVSQGNYDTERVKTLLNQLIALTSDFEDTGVDISDSGYEKEKNEIDSLYLSLVTEGKDSLLESLLIDRNMFERDFAIEPFDYQSEGKEYQLSIELLTSVDERELEEQGYIALTMTDYSIVWSKIDDYSISYIDPVRKLMIKKEFNDVSKNRGVKKAISDIPTSCIDATKGLINLFRNDDNIETWRNNLDVVKSVMDGISCFYEVLYDRLSNILSKNDLLEELRLLRRAERGRYRAWLIYIFKQKRVIPLSDVVHLREIETNISKISQSITNLQKNLTGPVNRILNKLPKRLTSDLPRLGNTTRTLGRVTGGLGIIISTYDAYCDCRDFYDTYKSWITLKEAIDRKIPCYGEEEKALVLQKNIISNCRAFQNNCLRIISADIIGLVADAASLKLKTWKDPRITLGLYVGSVWLNLYTEVSKMLSIEGKFNPLLSKYWYEYHELDCKKDDPNDDDDNDYKKNKKKNGGDHKSNNKDKKFSIDPSGFVYEGVPSNRLQGVTATAYYKEKVEDMYGDMQENIVKWDASEYAQENPLFTDEYGMYQWDVPQGLWQVKFEKEGYETTYSDWLPVPPPQLDINIPMTHARQPEVKEAHAYEDGVEFSFDKYMQPASLTTGNIMVSQNGEDVKGEVKMIDEETAAERGDVKFASRVRFIPETPFKDGEVTLHVASRVKSYADIPMQEDYEQTLPIEKEVRVILVDSIVKIPYNGTSTITVKVLSADAAAGKTLNVKTSSPMILSIEKENYVIDEDGQAAITVTGELPGIAALTFSVEGTDKTATTIVNVEQAIFATISAPTASIASGSLVQGGTQITLSCETEGATIYYTTDGSCPCDEKGSRMVYDGTPIVITKDVTIKAMAVAPDGAESEVVEFVYVVGTGIDGLSVDDDVQVYPLPVHDKLNVTAGGKLIKSVTVSSTSGTAVAALGKPMAKVTLDVSHIPAGIYIVAVTTEKGGYSCKIVKEQ